ncbi:hypothetical protein [Cardinium endosymbiont of Culicoides punctatus]|uniref:hypothetical protein n=1 Tax=Cardinium endosymbiont of Culicoides punctatus TaxID=2304601 RepID=UPI001058E0CE|nr:hypothetical protein [Cardinium endosymbiont of Culicoides punctatus]TDG95737.1 hypothetical protein CCPUN_00210 [Cardinium endosymbiont of Culicoides punctatus]
MRRLLLLTICLLTTHILHAIPRDVVLVNQHQSFSERDNEAIKDSFLKYGLKQQEMDQEATECYTYWGACLGYPFVSLTDKNNNITIQKESAVASEIRGLYGMKLWRFSGELFCGVRTLPSYLNAKNEKETDSLLFAGGDIMGIIIDKANFQLFMLFGLKWALFENAVAPELGLGCFIGGERLGITPNVTIDLIALNKKHATYTWSRAIVLNLGIRHIIKSV